MRKNWFLFFFLVFSILFFSDNDRENAISHSSTAVVEIGSASDKRGVYFTSRVFESLSAIYSSATTEIPICLHGNTTRQRVVVTDITIPHILESSKDSTEFGYKNCVSKGDFVGVVHNHNLIFTEAACGPSKADAKSFMKNPDTVLEVVACPHVIEKDIIFKALSRKRNW